MPSIGSIDSLYFKEDRGKIFSETTKVVHVICRHEKGF